MYENSQTVQQGGFGLLPFFVLSSKVAATPPALSAAQSAGDVLGADLHEIVVWGGWILSIYSMYHIYTIHII